MLCNRAKRAIPERYCVFGKNPLRKIDQNVGSDQMNLFTLSRMKKLYGQMKYKIPVLKNFLLVIALTLLFLPKNVNAQTWVTTDFWDSNYGIYVNHDSSNVGPLEMCRTPNGLVNMLVMINEDQLVNRTTYQTNGNLIVNSQTSHSGGIFSEWTTSLNPLPDNGVVYIVTHISTPNDFTKTYKTGVHPWTKTDFQPAMATEVMQTYYNTTLILYPYIDSLVEVDSMGIFIRARSPFHSTFSCLQDSDLIVFESNQITKQDFNGNVRWTYIQNNLTPISGDTANIYCKNGSSVYKIRTKDGSLVWSHTIPNNYISLTNDSGLIVTNGFEISRYDSAGNNLWSRIDSFPLFGFKAIMQDNAGYFYTGGAFSCVSVDYTGHRGFSYFITRLDSIGNGTLDSTDHYFTGNANDNYVRSFSDDAAFIGAALGSTGQPLPSIMHSFTISSISAFGPDWSGSFSTGLNHKFSDVDGNGLLDTNDLHALAYSTSFQTQSTPHWRKASSNSSTPNLYVSVAEDTLLPGDSATIFVYTDPVSVVDSIYSLSMEISTYAPLYQMGGIAIDYPNNFGTSGLNSFSYFQIYPQSNLGLKYLMCKNNYLNSTLQGDTLVKFRIAVASVASGMYSMNFNFHAITKGGYDVPFNPNVDSVFYFDPATVVNELHDQSFLIVPNPSNGFFTLASRTDIDELVVMNSEGKIILKRNDHLNSIDLSAQPDGIYFVRIKADNQVIRKRLTLIH
jgi:hypothetical protein